MQVEEGDIICTKSGNTRYKVTRVTSDSIVMEYRDTVGFLPLLFSRANFEFVFNKYGFFKDTQELFNFNQGKSND